MFQQVESLLLLTNVPSQVNRIPDWSDMALVCMQELSLEEDQFSLIDNKTYR